jgi:fructokinase
MTPPKHAVICFGEILWDCLPEGDLPGGAPMNVALHLNQMGVSATIISRVGNDAYGNDILQYIADRRVDTGYIQLDESLPTGTVKADVSDPTAVTYTINYPVAWDFIEWTAAAEQQVNQADMLLFGSLATRNEVSYQALKKLIDTSSFRVFDVNLRQPHYTRNRIEEMMQAAHLVKMNEEELALISSWYGPEKDQDQQMKELAERFSLKSVCVTLGANGARLLDRGTIYSHQGYTVKVKDTIGSGDAFLAALLARRLQGKPAREQLAFACAAGAFVATQPGATPSINQDDISALATT